MSKREEEMGRLTWYRRSCWFRKSTWSCGDVHGGVNIVVVVVVGDGVGAGEGRNWNGGDYLSTGAVAVVVAM